MRRKKDVTLRDIADELQLTVHTVSKALRGLPGMSEATRKAVFMTAARLGYRTKERELSLGYEKIPLLTTNRRRFTIVLLQDTPFYRTQLQGVQERLHELGHTLTAHVLPEFTDGPKQLERWLEQAELTYSDGLFVPPAMPEPMESVLLRLPMPKVLISYPPPAAPVDSVIWDVETAIHQSVDHLVAKGHRRLLYIGDIRSRRGFRLRWSAFQAALRRHGIEAAADPMTELPTTPEQWRKELEERLRSGGYTAILHATGNTLNTLLFVLQSLGLSVPNDISLVSMPDLEDPRFPQLSRPSLLVRETGRRAAERLLWRIANPAEPYEHTRLAGTFIAGETVADLTR